VRADPMSLSQRLRELTHEFNEELDGYFCMNCSTIRSMSVDAMLPHDNPPVTSFYEVADRVDRPTLRPLRAVRSRSRAAQFEIA
jgi:hypothetical protein